MKALSLSRSGDDIPAERFDEIGRHIIACGASGSGKTAAVKVVLDQDLTDGRHVVIVDPDDMYAGYGNVVKTQKQVLAYLAEAPAKTGVRIVTEKPTMLIELLEAIFNECGARKRRKRPLRLTVVVDEITVFYRNLSAPLRQRLADMFDQIADRGRGRGFWGIWVAPAVAKVPDEVLRTARLALIGQHKDEAECRRIGKLFSGLADRDCLPHLRAAEFVVWTAGLSMRLTVRAPERGKYGPIIYAAAAAADSFAGDVLGELYAIPRSIYRRLAACEDAFNLLWDLTDAPDEVAGSAWTFIAACAQQAQAVR